MRIFYYYSLNFSKITLVADGEFMLSLYIKDKMRGTYKGFLRKLAIIKKTRCYLLFDAILYIYILFDAILYIYII